MQPTETPYALSPRVTLFAFVGVLVALAASGVLLLMSRPTPTAITIIPPEPTVTPLPSVTPAPLQIYVTGAVASPQQVVQLPVGSRVQDALTAAGGTLPNADLERVNLADILRDGDQVHVPLQAQAAAEIGAGVVDVGAQVADEAELATPARVQTLNINTATLAELTTLPRIGEVTAARIIAYREANGAFSELAQLGEVEGIGDATLTSLAPLIRFSD